LLRSLPTIIANLEKEEVYFIDFDITQDLVGTFDKGELTEYLCTEHNFTCEKEECYTIVAYILDNDNSVGRDCLTWLTDDGRFKVYNKFVCQLTSPGVNKTVGTHILDVLDCPDKRLADTFANLLAKEYSLTILKVTITDVDL